MADSTALNLELDDDPPENWTPLECVVTVKCLDEEGKVQMWHTASPALNTWEAWGMAMWTAKILEDGAMGDTLDDDDDDG